MTAAAPAGASLLPVDWTRQSEVVRDLLREYAASLRIDLGFQHFEDELAALPGDYSPPAGAMLLQSVGNELAGCGGFRPLRAVGRTDACEMKRLFVRPMFRGQGLGRQMAEALLDEARRAGYGVMYLDTLEDMGSARQLYGRLGFIEVAPYHANPVAGMHYLKATLGSKQC